MSRTDDRAVMFMVERGTTEVDKPDVRPFYTPNILSLEKGKLNLNSTGLEFFIVNLNH